MAESREKAYEPSELRHYAKRAELYGLDKEKGQLVKSARKITEKGELPGSGKQKLNKALYRVAQIPNLDKTCIRQDCLACSKLVEDLAEQKEERPWQLNYELYRWQKQCKKAWKGNSGKGIVKVITGAGKTVVALSLIEELFDRYQSGGLKTVVVVPTTALLDQWEDEFLNTLNAPQEQVGTYYGESKDNIEDHSVMLYVLNSARENLQSHLSDLEEDVFLIVDECHRAGSSENSRVFNSRYDYALGLSATPERRADYAFEEILTTNLGDVIYDYSYSEAREDGIIPTYRLKRIAVPLTDKEQTHYEKYTKKLKKTAGKLMSSYPELGQASGDEFLKKLGSLQSQYDDSLFESYTILTNKRKEIIHESKSKIAALEYLINNEIDPRARILIFHERIEYADLINDYFQDNGIDSTVYHTGAKPQERRDNLRRYKDGEVNVLITCRALDEGLDVPDTSVGIIVAATSSVRQRIQRVGRILRKSPGKDYSEIYTIYVENLEDRIFTESDMKNLEKSAEKIEKIELGFG